LTEIKTVPNKAYSLWLATGCQQGFCFAACFRFGGQESANLKVNKNFSLQLYDF